MMARSYVSPLAPAPMAADPVAPPAPVSPAGAVAPAAVVPPAAVTAPAGAAAPVSPPGATSAPAVAPSGTAPPAQVAPPAGDVDSDPPALEPAGDPSGEIAPMDAPTVDAAAAPDGEHPLAATNSPWTQTSDGTGPPVPLPPADALPSAQLPSAQAVPAADEPDVEPAVAPVEAHGSRTLMTVGLAIAAVALIALVAYFMTSSDDVSDDPTSVGGVEQRDYGDDPPPTTATATAAPAPRPVPRPVPTPSGQDDIYEGTDGVGKPAPKPPPDDFYDDL